MCCGTCKVLPPEPAMDISVDVDDTLKNVFTKLIGVRWRRQRSKLPLQCVCRVLVSFRQRPSQWHRLWGSGLLKSGAVRFGHAAGGTPDWAALLRRMCDSLPSTCHLPRHWLANRRLPNAVECEAGSANPPKTFPGPPTKHEESLERSKGSANKALRRPGNGRKKKPGK